jgi:hypothetical protein
MVSLVPALPLDPGVAAVIKSLPVPPFNLLICSWSPTISRPPWEFPADDRGVVVSNTRDIGFLSVLNSEERLG